VVAADAAGGGVERGPVWWVRAVLAR